MAAALALALTTAAAARGATPAETRAQVFEAAWTAVDESFYDPHFHGADWAAIHERYRAQLAGVTDDTGLQRLITAMLGELKSSHLYVSRTTPGASGMGVGVRTEMIEGAETVVELAPLSDAAVKGVKVGDRLTVANGPAGSLADVSVQRCDGTKAQLKVRGERWSFPLRHPGFEWSRLRVAPDRVIGYIRIDRFDDGAAELADQAMADLARTQGIVIDVRANSGGNISALRLASWFIEGGGPGVALFGRPYLQTLGHPVTAADIAKAPKVAGRYTDEGVYNAITEGNGAAVFLLDDLGAKRYRGPVVVLIGPETGSAAEGFAWAMKTRSAARLIGQRTSGYILSGQDFDIAPGWSLTVPTAGLWSPAGEDLGDRAVTPHEALPAPTRAEVCAGRDRAAERAVAILGEAVR